MFPDDGHIPTVVYIQTIDPKIEQVRNEFLENVGGQLYVQCNEYYLPLITSTKG